LFELVELDVTVERDSSTEADVGWFFGKFQGLISGFFGGWDVEDVAYVHFWCGIVVD
jgi:hypothetical protein